MKQKTVWERKKMLMSSIYYSTIFYAVKDKLYHLTRSEFVVSRFCKDGQVFVFIVKYRVNSFPRNPNFKRTQQGSCLKTLWEKEKMLVISIFSFFPQCFLPFQNQNSISESHLFCCLQILSIWTSLQF